MPNMKYQEFIPGRTVKDDVWLGHDWYAPMSRIVHRTPDFREVTQSLYRSFYGTEYIDRTTRAALD